MDENANVENEASMSDANGARCEVSVAKLDETKACQFVRFAGADNASDESEGQRRGGGGGEEEVCLLAHVTTTTTTTTRTSYSKKNTRRCNRSEQKENVRYRLFHVRSKGKTIEIDVEYET